MAAERFHILRFQSFSRWIFLSLLSSILLSCVANVTEPGDAVESNLIFSTTANGQSPITTRDFGIAAVGGYYDVTLYVYNAGRVPAQNILDSSSVGQKFSFVGGAFPGPA